MQTEQQGKAQFLIDGAAHYDAIFKPLKKTSQVLVNGKLTSVEKAKLGVRIQNKGIWTGNDKSTSLDM